MDRTVGKSRRLGFVRRTAVGAVVGIVFYLNAAALLSSSGVRIDLPRPWYADRLFQIFSLFSYYTSNNYGFEAVARVAGSADSPHGERWIPIDLYEYFPQTVGEANRRLFQYSFRNAPARKQAGHYAMIDRIKVLHNREPGGERIDRIRFYRLSWPKSTKGYRGEYDSRRRELVAER